VGSLQGVAGGITKGPEVELGREGEKELHKERGGELRGRKRERLDIRRKPGRSHISKRKVKDGGKNEQVSEGGIYLLEGKTMKGKGTEHRWCG